MTLTKEEKWLLEDKHGCLMTEEFKADCKRLAFGEPLGYVIRYVPFLDCKIWLDLPAQAGSRPLIPRPETEYWTEKAIMEIKKIANDVRGSTSNKNYVNVLDLCAGSGCIGIAVAKSIPELKVDFSEINPAYLPIIERNLVENTIIYDSVSKKMYRIILSNLFNSKSNIKFGRYDFILCNPPYIDPETDRTEKSVRDFEPLGALYGGQGGVELIHRIISESPKYLHTKGQLWIEHEPEQTKKIHNLARKSGFEATTHKDQYAVERYSILVLQ